MVECVGDDTSMKSARSSASFSSTSWMEGASAVLRPPLDFQRLPLVLGLGALQAMMGAARQSRRMAYSLCSESVGGGMFVDRKSFGEYL